MNLNKVSLKISFSNKNFIFLVILYYVLIWLLFLFGIYDLNFLNWGEPSFNDDFPGVRMPLLTFILMYPALVLITYLTYNNNESLKKMNYSIGEVFKWFNYFLLYFCLWPGIFLVIGFYFHILDSFIIAYAPGSPYQFYYIFIFFFIKCIYIRFIYSYLHNYLFYQ